jgi:hypothetical protein
MLKFNITGIDVKNLNVWIYSLCGFGIAIELSPYDHDDESVLLSFSCSGFALLLFCMCVLSLPPSVNHF